MPDATKMDLLSHLKIGLDKWVWTKNFINGLLGIRKNFRGDFTILLEDTNFLIRVRVFFHFFS